MEIKVNIPGFTRTAEVWTIVNLDKANTIARFIGFAKIPPRHRGVSGTVAPITSWWEQDPTTRKWKHVKTFLDWRPNDAKVVAPYTLPAAILRKYTAEWFANPKNIKILNESILWHLQSNEERMQKELAAAERKVARLKTSLDITLSAMAAIAKEA